jgi:acetylornithine deacetylase/succinyl-diaminopimelate desuccinylase-like protein
MASTDKISSIYQCPAELLQRVIRFDTTNPPGNETECIAFIHGLLNEAGIEARIFAKTPERPNLIARLSGRGNAAPLLLYGHVDVVTTQNQEWRWFTANEIPENISPPITPLIEQFKRLVSKIEKDAP